MKAFAALALFLLLGGMVASCAPDSAKDASPVPPLTGRVVDIAGALPAAREEALSERLRAFEARKGAQVAVLLIETTAPLALEDYAIKVAEAWKLGREKSDDGAILLVALEDRAARIEVGYGLEGALSDLVSKKIIEDILIPEFRAGDIPGGIEAAVDAMLKVIDGEALPGPDALSGRDGHDGMGGGGDGGGGGFGNLLPILFFVVLGGGAVARMLFGRLVGAGLGGGLAGLAAWFFSGTLILGILAALLGFIFLLFQSGGGGGGFHRGGRGWGGFGGGGGGFRGGGLGGFSGRGGGFGGGGASGRW